MPKKQDRRFSRIPICRLAKIQIPSSGESKLGQIFDLSESGMSLHVTDLSSDGIQFVLPQSVLPTENIALVKQGDMLRVVLQLDPQHSEIAISGRVAWIKRVMNKRKEVHIRIGIEFKNISDMDRKLIQVYVAALKP